MTHAFNLAATEALSAGVPVGCGSVPMQSEPPCISGALGNVESLDVVGGKVWISDRPGASGRIDGFEAGSPWGFVGPQIDEEGGVTGLGGVPGASRGSRISVGAIGGEEQVYALASREGHEVVAVYGAGSGKLLGSWSGVRTANKSFTQVAGTPVAVLRGVAVDRSTNPLSAGNVYVATGAGSKPEFHVVDVFSSEPAGVIGEEPEVVATLAGTCATPGTSCGGEAVPFQNPEGVEVSPANGDVYVTDVSGPQGQIVIDVFRPGPLHEYVYIGQTTGPPGGSLRQVAGVAGDSGAGLGHGEVYVADTSSAREAGGVVYQFDEEGGFLGRLNGPSASSVFDVLAGVGVDASSHDVFVAEDNPQASTGQSSRVDVFGPDLVLPDVETKSADVAVDVEGHVTAMLHGSVNPHEGEAGGPAACGFVWGPTRQFGHSAPCSEAPVEGDVPVQVHAAIGAGLAPDTTYWFRLQASNANGLNTGEEQQDLPFHTPGPGIDSVSSADVASTSATLEGQVDPNHAETSVFFQYTTAESTAGCGPGGEQCAVAPAGAPDKLGAGSGDVGVSEHIQGLAPHTAYHYRLVVVSELEVEGVATPVTFFSEDRVLQTTVASSPGSDLLDGRHWELVSPPNKHGAVIYKPGISGISVAAEAGGLINYPFTNATEPGVAGFGESVQVLSNRGSGGGWSSRDISLPHSHPIGKGAGGGLEYKAVADDGCLAVAEPNGPFTSLVPDVSPLDTERTPYVRYNCTCSSEPATCYAPIATGAVEGGDVTSGAPFGGEEGTPIRTVGPVNFVGGAADLKHVIVASKVQLTSAATPAGVRELYEWSAEKAPAERLELISRDEANQPSAVRASLGYEAPGSDAVGRAAVSNDGSRVFWMEEHGGLFVRDVGMGVSLRLDVAQGGSGSGVSNPVFQGASADGTRVFFEDEQRLTANSGATVGKPDLYVCDLAVEAEALRCALTDLSPAGGGVSGAVQGSVSGLNSDGSLVYFVGNGVLPGTAAEGALPGACSRSASPVGATCNLYVANFDTGAGWGGARLVTVLSGDDFPDWGGRNGTEFAELTAAVSGEWLAFMSDRPLTGFDNRDVAGGAPDEEVFEYNAGSGRLECVSCSRSGGRPEGVEYRQIKEGLVGGNGEVWNDGQWLAASVPGYEQYELTRALYQPRYLSGSGRVFFDAAGALVAGDVNGQQDVYEWEPLATGECSEASGGFDGPTGGCLGLVSSGRGAGESVFMDASASGGDAFFLTGERLVRADSDTAVDMYDAHECTTASPCPVELQAPAECVTTDSCRSSVSPAPSIFGAPASSTFSGEGNTTPHPGSLPKKKSAAQLRSEKLARTLKGCRKDHNKRKRRACEASARKRYGKRVVKKASRSTVGRGVGR